MKDRSRVWFQSVNTTVVLGTYMYTAFTIWASKYSYYTLHLALLLYKCKHQGSGKHQGGKVNLGINVARANHTWNPAHF